MSARVTAGLALGRDPGSGEYGVGSSSGSPARQRRAIDRSVIVAITVMIV